MPEPYAWVGWLGDKDTQVLLISLMAAIEQGVAMETLQAMVNGWRASAHHALTADDYRACVDKFLEVYVDARVHLLRTGRIPDEEDASHGLP